MTIQEVLKADWTNKDRRVGMIHDIVLLILWRLLTVILYHLN